MAVLQMRNTMEPPTARRGLCSAGGLLLRPGRFWFALQYPRLLNHAHKIRDRLFVDGRRLSLSPLRDFRQVVAGQDREARCHGPLKRGPNAQANRPIGITSPHGGEIASLKIQQVPSKLMASSRRSWACWGIAIPGSSHRRQAFIQLGRDVLSHLTAFRL